MGFPNILIGILFLVWCFSGVLIVRGKTAAIVEFLGKPLQWAKMPGLHLILPWPLMTVAGRVDLRLRELRASVSVKTKDNAFVELPVATQFRAKNSGTDAVRAFYELADPEQQIKSYILNIVRQAASNMDLSDLYTNRDNIASSVENALSERFNSYGYLIEAVLVDEPQPSREVQASFNRVIAAARELEAAKLEANAERTRLIGVAEAEAESKRLQGQGIAQQRTEIAKGLKEAVDTFKEALPEADYSLLIGIMMMTNQLDTISNAAQHPSTTILMPYGSESALKDMNSLLAMLEAYDPDKMAQKKAALKSDSKSTTHGFD